MRACMYVYMVHYVFYSRIDATIFYSQRVRSFPSTILDCVRLCNDAPRSLLSAYIYAEFLVSRLRDAVYLTPQVCVA